ncbi:MAG: hypothetical protein M3Y54_03560 [Bacteroidota bacterium]|nr:hypothetical protein [Bacteroidota bacterium]
MAVTTGPGFGVHLLDIRNQLGNGARFSLYATGAGTFHSNLTQPLDDGAALFSRAGTSLVSNYPTSVFGAGLTLSYRQRRQAHHRLSQLCVAGRQ